jgi:hypothetical protein
MRRYRKWCDDNGKKHALSNVKREHHDKEGEEDGVEEEEDEDEDEDEDEEEEVWLFEDDVKVDELKIREENKTLFIYTLTRNNVDATPTAATLTPPPPPPPPRRPTHDVSSPLIEVEDKFTVTPSIIAKLTEIGTLTSDYIMHDIYFDISSNTTSPYPLVTRDVWLRLRTNTKNKKVTKTWEIKVPMENQKNRKDGGSRTVYREFDTVEKIGEVVAGMGLGHAQPPAGGNRGHISSYVPNVRPYADFSTRRRLWIVNPPAASSAADSATAATPVNVVIDESDIDGFTVGEVEVLVKEEDVATAGEKLDAAKRIIGVDAGAEAEKAKDGKLFMFVQKYNPELLKIAQEAGSM